VHLLLCTISNAISLQFVVYSVCLTSLFIFLVFRGWSSYPGDEQYELMSLLHLHHNNVTIIVNEYVPFQCIYLGNYNISSDRNLTILHIASNHSMYSDF
jgi:hypothetical protein